MHLKDIVCNIVSRTSNAIILNISGRDARQGMDDYKLCMSKSLKMPLKKRGKVIRRRKQSNCLVVLDEAHRYISTYSYDDGIKQLTTSIIDAVRTTENMALVICLSLRLLNHSTEKSGNKLEYLLLAMASPVALNSQK